MSNRSIQSVDNAMKDLCDFWAQAYKGFKTIEDWERKIPEESRFIIHPDDYKELGVKWIEDYKKSVDKRLDENKGDRKRGWLYAPPHAYFGKATSLTKIVVLLINPRLDTKTDDSQKKTYKQYKSGVPFYPWSAKDGWEWHRRWLWGESDQYMCHYLHERGELGDSDVFQLELFPYPTNAEDEFVKPFTSGKVILPSQEKALAVLAALLEDENSEDRIYLFPSESKLNVWKNLLQQIEGKNVSGLTGILERRAVVKRSAQNRSLTFTNLVFLSDLKKERNTSSKRLKELWKA